MSLDLWVWLYLLCCVGAANLPWLSTRLLGIWDTPTGDKGIWMCLLEWLLLALLTGAFGFFLEWRSSGALHPKSGEFYVILLLLFGVFAVPGFIYRQVYLPFMARRAAAPASPGDSAEVPGADAADVSAEDGGAGQAKPGS